MIDKNTKTLHAGGTFGDALFVSCKIINNNLQNAHLTFYCAIENACPLIQGFFDLQGLNAIVVHKSNYVSFLRSIKSYNITINTIWDGVADKGKEYNDDGLEINPLFDVQGVPDFKSQFENYFVVQTDAGVQYHNERKHWDSIDLVKSMGLLFAKKTGLNVVFVGNEPLTDLPDNAIDITGTGYQIINYVKGAKFYIGLSSFVTFVALMSGVPSIVKYENDNVASDYFHPDWLKRMLFVDEIQPELNHIKEYLGFEGFTI